MFSLHVEALAWLRYGKRYPVVCTEAGPWRADVLGLSSKTSVEVEIKKSVSDLYNEIKNKSHKHFLYGNADDVGGFVPNYFYVFVPEELADKTLAYVAEKLPHAGVACLTQPARSSFMAGKYVSVIRNPKRLHREKPPNTMIRSAIMRMASEICGLRLSLEQLRAQTPITYEQLQKVFADAGILPGRMDDEEDLLSRARELSDVVTGLPWEQVPEEERQIWATRADTLLRKQWHHSEELPLEQID